MGFNSGFKGLKWISEKQCKVKDRISGATSWLIV